MKTVDQHTQEEKQELSVDETSLDKAVRQCLRTYFNTLGDRVHDEQGLYPHLLKTFETAVFEEALKITDGNQSKAAKILGINRNTLRRKV